MTGTGADPRIKTDLHVHTVASGHAYSTIREICDVAARRGIEMVGMTDHGPALGAGAHPFHFSNLIVVPRVLSGVKILRSAECNITGPDGELDLHDGLLQRLDIVHAGFHPFTGYEGGSVEENTRAVLAVIESGKVDVLVHPGNPLYPLDYGTVVRAAASNNVLLEVNNSSGVSVRRGSEENCRSMIAEAKRLGALLCVGTDAHDASLVGIFDNALKLIDEAGFPDERIANRDVASVCEFLRSRGRKDIAF
ncbi:MAG: phosphatase [Actinomycetota bacterium]